jgi:hypothetical protein
MLQGEHSTGLLHSEIANFCGKLCTLVLHQHFTLKNQLLTFVMQFIKTDESKFALLQHNLAPSATDCR